MSTAASPNPNNMLLLALLGIGAYWMFSRRAMAQPVVVRPGTQQQSNANKLNGVANVLNSVQRFFGSSTSAPAVSTRTPYYSGQLTQSQYAAAATAAQADSNPDTNGSVADWASNDGIAFNPPGNVSAYDAWVDDVYYN